MQKAPQRHDWCIPQFGFLLIRSIQNSNAHCFFFQVDMAYGHIHLVQPPQNLRSVLIGQTRHTGSVRDVGHPFTMSFRRSLVVSTLSSLPSKPHRQGIHWPRPKSFFNFCVWRSRESRQKTKRKTRICPESQTELSQAQKLRCLLDECKIPFVCMFSSCLRYYKSPPFRRLLCFKVPQIQCLACA
jgi:hypothetical protein